MYRWSQVLNTASNTHTHIRWCCDQKYEVVKDNERSPLKHTCSTESVKDWSDHKNSPHIYPNMKCTFKLGSLSHRYGCTLNFHPAAYGTHLMLESLHVGQRCLALTRAVDLHHARIDLRFFMFFCFFLQIPISTVVTYSRYTYYYSISTFPGETVLMMSLGYKK